MIKEIAAIFLSFISICNTYSVTKRALLIGISDYPTYSSPELTWNPIHGSNDIKLIGNTLRKQGFSVTMLTDFHATADRIRTALRSLANNCHAGDMVYIHFSGHGQAYEDLSGDETDGWDEAIVPYDAMRQYKRGVYDGSNHIIDDELEYYLSAIRSRIGRHGYVYLILDACHMGGASRGDEIVEEELFIRGTDDGFTPNGKKYIPKIDRRGNMTVQSKSGMSGICILEACRAYQTNAEIKQDGNYYGPLTYYVNRILLNTPLTSDTGWIETVRSLMEKDRRLIKQNMVSEKSN